VLAAIVVGYALSPIDLVPDFIPVLGYLDDLVLIPLGILWVVKLIPAEVMQDARDRAALDAGGTARKSRAAAAVIVALWIGLAALFIYGLSRFFH
jgi:uncharacterized membrane protein YkvA (DUF1232 family)